MKLFIDFKKCLNLLMKDERLNLIKISSEENDNLSDIIDIAFHTVNQQKVFYQETFFLLIKEIVIINKAICVLLQSFIKNIVKHLSIWKSCCNNDATYVVNLQRWEWYKNHWFNINSLNCESSYLWWVVTWYK